MSHQPSTPDTISDNEVKSYLQNHPEFFEKHAKLLTEIMLPSPHGSGIISLAERQQIAQRDKIRMLETLMDQMISNAEENESISTKVHRFGIQLISHPRFNGLEQLIANMLQTDFSVSQSMIRIWIKPSNSAIAHDVMFTPLGETFNDWAGALKQPYCGGKPEAAPALFDDSLQSFAYIPLYKNADEPHAFGVLVLASDNSERFKAGMGTLHLERLGEMVAAAMLNHLFTLNL